MHKFVNITSTARHITHANVKLDDNHSLLIYYKSLPRQGKETSSPSKKIFFSLDIQRDYDVGRIQTANEESKVDNSKYQH